MSGSLHETSLLDPTLDVAVIITDEQRRDALAYLRRRNALDLADMLGLIP